MNVKGQRALTFPRTALLYIVKETLHRKYMLRYVNFVAVGIWYSESSRGFGSWGVFESGVCCASMSDLFVFDILFVELNCQAAKIVRLK